MGRYKMMKFSKIEDFKRIIEKDKNSPEKEQGPYTTAMKVGFSGLSKIKSNEANISEDIDLVKKLSKKSREKGIEMVVGPDGISPSYSNKYVSRDGKGWEDFDEKESEYLDQVKFHKESKEFKTAMRENKPFVLYAKNNLNSTELAHEVGHGIDEKEGVLGEFRYKPGRASKWADSVNSSGYTVSSGLLSGVAAGLYDSKDRPRRSKFHAAKKAGILATPYAGIAAGNSLQLINERNASKNGLKVLKDLGASKEHMDNSKKALKLSYGGYLVDPAMAVLKTAGSQAVGYGVGRGVGSIVKRLNKKKINSKKKDKDSKESN